jgi:hypothetical protein
LGSTTNSNCIRIRHSIYQCLEHLLSSNGKLVIANVSCYSFRNFFEEVSKRICLTQLSNLRITITWFF